MIFLILMVLITASLAGSAAYFSIYGLGQVFSGSFTAVVIMGIALEASKLMAASYLYRYWKDTSFMLKTYLMSAVFVLMVITSMGIYGFLSASYQKDTIGLKDVDAKIELINNELVQSENRLAGINKQIESVPETYVSKRMELIEKFAPEKDKVIERINELNQERLKLSTNKIETEAKIGPIIYIAEQLGKDADSATAWFILIIVIVFDPLAVSLTLATNKVIEARLVARKEEEPEIVEEKELTEEEQEMEANVKMYLLQLNRDKDNVMKSLESDDISDEEREQLQNKLAGIIESIERYS